MASPMSRRIDDERFPSGSRLWMPSGTDVPTTPPGATRGPCVTSSFIKRAPPGNSRECWARTCRASPSRPAASRSGRPAARPRRLGPVGCPARPDGRSDRGRGGRGRRGRRGHRRRVDRPHDEGALVRRAHAHGTRPARLGHHRLRRGVAEAARSAVDDDPQRLRGGSSTAGQGAGQLRPGERVDARLRVPETDDVVVCADADHTAIGLAEPDGPATVETDAAARVLLLWGRRPADPSRIHSHGGAETLGQLRRLLSGY